MTDADLGRDQRSDADDEVAAELLGLARTRGILRRAGMVVLADKGLGAATSKASSMSWMRYWHGPTGAMSRIGTATWVGCASGWRRSSTPSKASSA